MILLLFPKRRATINGLNLVSMKDIHDVDAIVLAIAHRAYQADPYCRALPQRLSNFN
jgi:hypothetical protein